MPKIPPIGWVGLGLLAAAIVGALLASATSALGMPIWMTGACAGSVAAIVAYIISLGT